MASWNESASLIDNESLFISFRVNGLCWIIFMLSFKKYQTAIVYIPENFAKWNKCLSEWVFAHFFGVDESKTENGSSLKAQHDRTTLLLESFFTPHIWFHVHVTCLWIYFHITACCYRCCFWYLSVSLHHDFVVGFEMKFPSEWKTFHSGGVAKKKWL